MNLRFEKYNGLGNDYLVYDCNKNSKKLNTDAIKLICNRNFGLGSDGILIGPIIKNNKISVKIVNPDGSIAEKSGNGVRIFAKYLKDAGYVKENEFNLNTLGGLVKVKYLNNKGTLMTVSMGKLSFDSNDVGTINTPQKTVNIPLIFGDKSYKCTCVSIGNPHCVIPMKEISKEKVCEIGRFSETAKYFPNRINTQIVKVIDRNNISIEIFERGAGYTLASGSSSCAAAGAVYKLGLVDNDITVHMPGGSLKIQIEKDMNVFMTGTVSYVGTMILSNEFFNNIKNIDRFA
ncbi:diaminopimelate epimerase [Clostridium sp. HCP1S3_B4]|uniref:diaminopimelate epimerase n=1 Tax=unclassified Clostridium TaxID=2614128 RepID=UPI003F8B1DA8